MSVSNATSSGIDYNLAFRQAANNGSTDTMLQIKSQWTQLDIISSGATSLQTAAHYACCIILAPTPISMTKKDTKLSTMPNPLKQEIFGEGIV